MLPDSRAKDLIEEAPDLLLRGDEGKAYRNLRRVAFRPAVVVRKGTNLAGDRLDKSPTVLLRSLTRTV